MRDPLDKATDSTPASVAIPLQPTADNQRRITDAEVRRMRRARGGRAVDRIGEGMEYVAHDKIWGAAAARRRRQMARRGLYGCATCGEWTPQDRLYVLPTKHIVCEPCLDAAGLDRPQPEIPAPHDPDLHSWEAEGGAPLEHGEQT